MSNESDKVKPSNDYIFKLIFGDENDKDILISFLNALFKEYDFLPYVEDIEIKNSETIKKYDEEKQGRLDIKAKIDNDTYVNIEMQTKDYSDVMDRSVYYCSRILSENTIKGSSYKYPKVIAIWIIKEQSTQDNPHYNRSNPIEIDQHFTIPGVIDKEYVKTTNKVTIIYIYLSKFKEGLYNEHIDSWLKFINNQDNYNRYDSSLEKASCKLLYLKQDKKTIQIIDSQEDKERDNAARIASAEEQGKNEGLKQGIKQGMKQGLKRGKEEGLKQGIKRGKEEGLKQGKEEMARNMLKEGLNINLIAKISGLTIDEIEELTKK
jgi:predicted transposase/invertase (TIGR01784 family)